MIAGFLEQNDQVVLEAFDLDPTPWRAQGRSTKPVNPVDVRRLGGNYWSADPTDLTGPSSDPDVLGGASLVLGVAGGATLVFNGTTITLGKLASLVSIGATPASLAAGLPTFQDMTALTAFMADLLQLCSTPPTSVTWALAAPQIALLAGAALAILTPSLPLLQTTTVLAGP